AAGDPGVATEALKSSVCRAGDDNQSIAIVLQDRRTAMSAAFLVTGPGWSGSCLVTTASGSASGGGRSAPLDPVTAALTVDERSSGGVGGGNASLLGGRSAAGVTTVK